MSEYDLTVEGEVVRIADGVVIPADSANCDWVEYQLWLNSGNVPTPYAPTAPTAGDIDAERDRRFGLGAPIDLGNGRTFVADIDNTSKINIMGLLMAGAAADFRDRDNVTHALSTADVASLAQQAMARVSAIYAASWALKALDPIPADYADDGHWPA